VLTAYTEPGYLNVSDKIVGGAEATVVVSGLPPVGNLVAAVRADPRLVKIISTVDNVSTQQGQLATAMTVVERVVGGKVGQYGLSAGATSQVPRAAA
jgi:hypothetical protein